MARYRQTRERKRRRKANIIGLAFLASELPFPPPSTIGPKEGGGPLWGEIGNAELKVGRRRFQRFPVGLLLSLRGGGKSVIGSPLFRAAGAEGRGAKAGGSDRVCATNGAKNGTGEGGRKNGYMELACPPPLNKIAILSYF